MLGNFLQRLQLTVAVVFCERSWPRRAWCQGTEISEFVRVGVHVYVDVLLVEGCLRA